MAFDLINGARDYSRQLLNTMTKLYWLIQAFEENLLQYQELYGLVGLLDDVLIFLEKNYNYNSSNQFLDKTEFRSENFVEHKTKLYQTAVELNDLIEELEFYFSSYGDLSMLYGTVVGLIDFLDEN